MRDFEAKHQAQLLLSVSTPLSSSILKLDCCDFCALPAPSTSSLKDGKFSSSSPPPLLQLPLRSSPFEGAEAVIESLKKSKDGEYYLRRIPVDWNLSLSKSRCEKR